MGSSHPPGVGLVAAAADADPVTLLVFGWLASKRSEHTRTAYARDIGITPRRQGGRAPTWLAWCQARGVHPVTGVSGLRVARGDGQRRTLALPGPAAMRIDAYLSGRADPAGVRGQRGADVRGQRGADVRGQHAVGVGGRPDWPARQPLFVTGTGRRLFPGDVWRLIRRLAAQAGLPDDLVGHLGPEAMRHSFAALYLDAGGSLGDLQQVMGHADSRTTQRYGQARQGSGGPPGEVVAAYLAARRR